MFRYILFIALFYLPILLNAEGIEEFMHASIYSFEEDIYPAESDSNSILTISNEHYKHLKHSLKWEWNMPEAQWYIYKPVGYQKKEHVKQ